jgi:hypothetical protein
VDYAQSSLLEVQVSLTLPDSEHLGAACRAHALSGRLTVLHSDGSCVSHLLLSPAFYAVTLHLFTSRFFYEA